MDNDISSLSKMLNIPVATLNSIFIIKSGNLKTTDETFWERNTIMPSTVRSRIQWFDWLMCANRNVLNAFVDAVKYYQKAYKSSFKRHPEICLKAIWEYINRGC